MSPGEKPDFTGLWEADLERSTLHGPRPRRILVRIEHQEPTLVQETLVSHAEGGQERLRFAFETNGKESTHSIRGRACKTRAHFEGRELWIESWVEAPGRTFHFRDRWSLSDDLETLVMAHRDGDLAGQISILAKARPEAAREFQGSA